MKTIIRCLMGLIDGLSFTMRRAVVAHAKEAGLSLTNKEIAQLREKKYDKERDRVLVNESRHLPTDESFKLAFRHFPKLYGSDFTLDTSGEQWSAFKRVVRVRNGFTHPKNLDQLGTIDAIPAVLPTIGWAATLYRELLRRVGERIGVALPVAHEATLTFKDRDHPKRAFFNESVVAAISQSGGNSLRYVRLIFDLLHRELLLSLDLVRREGGPSDPSWQFSLRTATRTVFSNLESNIWACKFFLEAGTSRGEIALSVEDLRSLVEGEVEDRVRDAWNLWSREFGSGYVVPRGGSGWKELRGLHSFRNRITHPKSPDSLVGGVKELDDLIAVLGFIIEHDEATKLDEDKWAKMGMQEIDMTEAADVAASEVDEQDEESG